MRNMTASKTPWISQYPEDWKQVPLHVLFSELKNKNKDGTEQNLLSLSYGNIIRKDINSNFGLLPESFNGYNIVDTGDIVLRLTDLQNDHRSLRTGLVNERGIITSAYCTLRRKVPLSSEYYHYLLHAFDIMKAFYTMGEGVRQSLGYDELSSVFVPQPSIHEQQAIVSFLDSKCAAIDEAIERHKKAIENLEEYRKATISSVIIRGIDKNANMKPSGIPGIGEIPNHYQPTRIKFLGTYRNGLTYSPSDVCDENEGTLVLRSSNIQDGKLTLDDNVYVKCDIDERLKVRDGDILICARNGSAKLVGKSAVIKGIVATYGAFMMVLRTNAYPQYMYYVLNSRVMDVYRASFSTTTVNQLTAGILGNLIVPYCPDRKEQIEIAKILDLVCGKIAEGINKHKNIIDKLQEYRKSIIYHAVTGKIDCRGADAS